MTTRNRTPECLLLCAIVMVLCVLINIPDAAEQKQPPPVVATEKPAEPETPAAVQQATAILDILGIVKPTLPEVLNDFVILGQQQGMKSSDTEEAKAQFFLLQMRGFVYQNCKKVAVARTEAAFDSAFKLKDTPQ